MMTEVSFGDSAAQDREISKRVARWLITRHAYTNLSLVDEWLSKVNRDTETKPIPKSFRELCRALPKGSKDGKNSLEKSADKCTQSVEGVEMLKGEELEDVRMDLLTLQRRSALIVL